MYSIKLKVMIPFNDAWVYFFNMEARRSGELKLNSPISMQPKIMHHHRHVASRINLQQALSTGMDWGPTAVGGMGGGISS